MPHRLETDYRKISWTVSANVKIGYCDCDICREETPVPSESQILNWVQDNDEGGYMWPGIGDNEWMPEGWSWCEPHALLCVSCTKAVTKALESRLKPKKG